MENETSGFVGIIIAVLMYTAVGSLAAILYMLIAPALQLPILSMGVLIGVWWLWMFVFGPPIVFYVSVLRATDPLTKLAGAMGQGKLPQKPE